MDARLEQVTGIQKPSTDGLLMANGAAKPADGSLGYAKGCLFLDYVAGVVYVNEGTIESSSFAAVTTS